MHLYEQLQANIKILREHQQRISQERSKMISQGWTIYGFNRTPRQQQRWNWRSSWRHQVPMNVHSLSIESYISIPWKAGVRGRSPYFKTGIKDWSLQEINSLLEDETKNEPFGHSNQHYVWRKKSEAFNPNTTITSCCKGVLLEKGPVHFKNIPWTFLNPQMKCCMIWMGGIRCFSCRHCARMRIRRWPPNPLSYCSFGEMCSLCVLNGGESLRVNLEQWQAEG